MTWHVCTPKIQYKFPLYTHCACGRGHIEPKPSLMGDPGFAKSHHYAASFRHEQDGDIWDGDVLREWATEKRSVMSYYTCICTFYVH